MEGLGMQLGRDASNLQGMVGKQNLAADSDFADRISMGTCALCNTLLRVRNNMEGLGMRLGREAWNLLGIAAGQILTLVGISRFFQVSC